MLLLLLLLIRMQTYPPNPIPNAAPNVVANPIHLPIPNNVVPNPIPNAPVVIPILNLGLIANTIPFPNNDPKPTLNSALDNPNKVEPDADVFIIPKSTYYNAISQHAIQKPKKTIHEPQSIQIYEAEPTKRMKSLKGTLEINNKIEMKVNNETQHQYPQSTFEQKLEAIAAELEKGPQKYGNRVLFGKALQEWHPENGPTISSINRKDIKYLSYILKIYFELLGKSCQFE